VLLKRCRHLIVSNCEGHCLMVVVLVVLVLVLSIGSIRMLRPYKI
jgi:hypothetical protein